MRRKVFDTAEDHRSACTQLQINGDCHATLQSGLDTRFEIACYVVGMATKELENFASHHGALCKICWVEHVNDAGGVELDEKVVVGENKVLEYLEKSVSNIREEVLYHMIYDSDTVWHCRLSHL